MKIVYFTHSLASCWNHGNAHFLRGVLRELIARGHEVAAYEPHGAWSLQNLLADAGEEGLAPYLDAYPELAAITYTPDADVGAMVDGADLVIMHEWNAPSLVAEVGRLRADGGRFTALFHDTHHRAVSEPEAITAFDLSGYDGVLAFGETLAAVYRRWGWGDRVFVWHEAADIRQFHPPQIEQPRDGLVWIGNWGDGERSEELTRFLFRPAQTVGLGLDIYGVRYPRVALETVRGFGADYRGWTPNASAPQIFAKHMATVHVPRRFYVDSLPGIPTIRVFEALACGIPLISAPWRDSERLFRVGEDFLMIENEDQMVDALCRLRDNPDLRASLVRKGLETILARHTCAHRVDELMTVLDKLHVSTPRLPTPLDA